MEPGILTKVIHDFLTTVDGELSLVKDEYFLIHSVIDKYWCYGDSNGKWGKFPSNNLIRCVLPELKPEECLFISIANYSDNGPWAKNHMNFKKGEMIVGMNSVDENWYFGRNDIKSGIFPISHVWKINSAFLKSSATKSVRKKARAKATMQASLDEEIDLTEGEILTVTEIMDDGWCRGVTQDGREGTFPETFVTYLDVDEPDEGPSTSVPQITLDPPPPDFPQSVTLGSPIYKDFGESVPKYQTSSSSLYDEPAPDYYDLYPDMKSEEPQADMPDPLGTQPYAITLFQFNAQFSNELNFKAGEVVHLVKYINKEWIEGSIEDKKGIFPASYVNVIVDCTESADMFTAEENGRECSTENTILEPGTRMKVQYSYQAQMDGDLSVTEDEVVSVVEMTNQDWITVENSKKETGLCPRTYLTEITDEELIQEEDFVVLRKTDEGLEFTENPRERSRKRLSEPHRPAPPAPSPNRTPLKVHQPETSASSAKQKRADQRQNVISELVLTEKTYVKDLKLTYETFYLHDPSLLQGQGIDVPTLFGNLDEVMQVAEELLDKIQRAMKGCDEEYQTIGPCFMKTSDKLLQVYRKYCGNHSASLELLAKYEDKKEMIVLNAGIEVLKKKIACFDMSSILIKPVQRILKYPLMLHELIKCTEDDHPDKPELEEAWRVMTDVATNINEYKRRKDMISKILDSDNTLMRKMARLNMHSVAKKSTRLSAKLSASLGLMALTSDPQFDEFERQFRALEKCAKDLAKDANQCVSHLREKSKCGEELAELIKDFYDGTPSSEVTNLKEVRRIIETQHIPQLVRQMKELVITPINSLVTALEGPAILIMKRNNKLIDYDNAIVKSEKYKDNATVKEELETTKNNFEVLNKHLLEELPILIDASTKIICECVKAFTSLRKLLSGKVLKHYLDLVEGAQITAQSISKAFAIDYNLSYNKDTSADNTIQSESLRSLLKSKYPKSELYEVTQTHDTTFPLNKTVAAGTIVGLKKKNDPMGNDANWIVDHGDDIIIFPSQFLRSWQEPENNNHTPDLMVLESPKKEAKPSTSNLQLLCSQTAEPNSINGLQGTQPQPEQTAAPEYCHAMYDFHHDIPGTLKINSGQALKIITRNDLKGNSEWWLVENRDGESGYVPRTYLELFS